jgi:hypothetical protein
LVYKSINFTQNDENILSKGKISGFFEDFGDVIKIKNFKDKSLLLINLKEHMIIGNLKLNPNFIYFQNGKVLDKNAGLGWDPVHGVHNRGLPGVLFQNPLR